MAITHLATAVGNAQAASLTYTLTAGQSIPAGSTVHVAAVAQTIGAAPTVGDIARLIGGGATLSRIETFGRSVHLARFDLPPPEDELAPVPAVPPDADDMELNVP